MPLLQHKDQLKELLDSGIYERLPPRKRLLVVHPKYFRIAEALNPHMKGSDGKLNEVNLAQAQFEWKELVRAFEKIGLDVQVIDGAYPYPDMVFAANQSFVFWNWKTHRPEVIFSRMTHESRRGEVDFFRKFFAAFDYASHELATDEVFEGAGDALLDPERPIIWCGYGFRTSKKTLERISAITAQTVVPLELKDPKFYHLDTCLAPLTKSTAVYVPEAFTDAGREFIEAAFENLIPCDPQEHAYMGANLFCPNGRNVIIDSGNKKLIEKLDAQKFNIHPISTSEFRKSGGSVFCLKMQIW